MTQLRELVRRAPGRRPLVLPAWFDRLASAGIVSKDPQIIRRQRCANVAAYVGAISGLSYILLTSIHDPRGLWPLNIHNALLVVGGLVLPLCHRFGPNVVGLAIVIVFGAGQTYVTWMLGTDSNLHVFFVLAGASLFFFGIENWKLFAAALLCLMAALVITINIAPEAGLLAVGDLPLRVMISNQTVISVAVINAALIFYALWLVERAEADLVAEHERSEALIATVLPAAIATRLKTSDARIADGIDNLSILFADLAGFTAATHDLPPDRVVSFLDNLVRRFDTLAEQHGVEKIKTIGDSYMAVAGFQNAQSGAVAIGRFALAIMDMNARQAPLGARKLDLRIGIHCGPAVAGVIGDTRFSYDVWGDGVNVASRMESQGVPGRVHVSEPYRNLTASVFAFEERGLTDIKGIGPTRTYLMAPK